MQRTIMSMLGALAVAAGFSMFAAPAQAYIIDCQVVPLSQKIYPTDAQTPPSGPPSHAYWCVNTITRLGATDQEGSAMAGAIRKMNSSVAGPAVDGYQKLKNRVIPSYSPPPTWPFTSPGLPFYIFYNSLDVELFFQERGLPYQPVPLHTFGGSLSVTTPGSEEGAVYYSYVMIKSSDGKDIFDVFSIQWTATHEAGHTLDKAYRPISQDTSPNDPRFSDSKMYFDISQKDIANLIHRRVVNCGIGGIFNGKTNSNGVYICTGAHGEGNALSTSFAGKDNYQVLVAIGGTNISESREFFANEVAKAVGHETGGTYAFSSYFDMFPCTMQLVRTVINTGALPTQAVMKAVGGRPGDGGRAGCPVKKGGADAWALPR